MEIKKRRNRKINLINLRIENQDKNLEYWLENLNQDKNLHLLTLEYKKCRNTNSRILFSIKIPSYQLKKWLYHGLLTHFFNSKIPTPVLIYFNCSFSIETEIEDTWDGPLKLISVKFFGTFLDE